MFKICRKKAKVEGKCLSKRAKIFLGIAGVGVLTGTAMAICLDQFMKKIFVDDKWPDEEWTGDDWAGEDIE